MAIKNTPRMNRLRAAQAKLISNLESDSKNPKAQAWRKRLEEYDESLRNLAKGERERPLKQPAGVDIRA